MKQNKQQIKNAYEQIQISEKAKQQIYQNIVTEKTNHSKTMNWKQKPWKVAIAACITLVLAVPTGTFAAEKVMQYFKSTVSHQGQKVSLSFKKTQANTDTSQSHSKNTPFKYVKLTTNFGDSYRLTKIEKGQLKKSAASMSATRSYSFKKGAQKGQDFWFELIYLNQDQKMALSTFDNSSYEQVTINGRKAVYCKNSTIIGSRYQSDLDTSYNQSVYLFLSDYGYLIRMSSQQKLGKTDLLKLAEKIQISEATSQKDANDYTLFSNMDKTAAECKAEEHTAQKIKESLFSKNASAKLDSGTLTVTDVKILDSAASLNKKHFNDNTSYVDSSKLFDKNGKLKSYVRETLKYGDGVNEPECQVSGTKKVQPKLVMVTAELDQSNRSSSDTVQVPSLQLITKKNGQYYNNNEGYNRPAYIENAFIDHMPCYFEETLGGKEFWFTNSTNGKKTIHFAYLVDEDQLDGMALCIDNGKSSPESSAYIDISK